MKKINLLWLFILVSCCEKNSLGVKTQEKEWINYLEIVSNANITDNETDINQAIKYIDNVLVKGGEDYIFSIYYDKAKLLFKLKRYCDALETLRKSKKNYDIQEAALLVCMGYDKDAKLILDNFIVEFKKTVTSDNITKDKLEILYIISLLSNVNFNDICSEYNNYDQASIEKLLMNKNGFVITKEELLQSMWPLKREFINN